MAFLSRAASTAVATAVGNRGVFVFPAGTAFEAGTAALLLRDLGVAMQSVYRSIQAMSDDMPLHAFRHQAANRSAGRQLRADLRGRHVARRRFNQVDASRGRRFARLVE